MAEEQATAERLNRSLEQALFTAESRVRGVSDYIDTRRGSIGAEARTRLAEAKRHLQAAQDKKSTNVAEAIAYANAASTLAAQRTIARQCRRSIGSACLRPRRESSDSGAMIGGIIIGDLLSGGMRGGLGGGEAAAGAPRPLVGRHAAHRRGREVAASWVAEGDSERQSTALSGQNAAKMRLPAGTWWYPRAGIRYLRSGVSTLAVHRREPLLG